jgi:hypothetical protein
MLNWDIDLPVPPEARCRRGGLPAPVATHGDLLTHPANCDAKRNTYSSQATERAIRDVPGAEARRGDLPQVDALLVGRDNPTPTGANSAAAAARVVAHVRASVARNPLR